MERETGFEPATSTLARSHSTTELFPLSWKRTFINYTPACQHKILSAEQLPEAQEVIRPRPDGENEGTPEKEHTDGLEIETEGRVMEHQRDDGRNLEAGLVLAQAGGGHIHLVLGNDVAQAGNGDFPADNDAGDPGRHPPQSGEHD